MLTLAMCDAMNRDVGAIVFGAASPAAPLSTAGVGPSAYTETSAAEVAAALAGARTVVIVPGYGLAVARAQYAVAQIAADLEARGVQVSAREKLQGKAPGISPRGKSRGKRQGEAPEESASKCARGKR